MTSLRHAPAVRTVPAIATVIVLAGCLAISPAAGAGKREAPPAAVGKLLGCRTIADGTARLACFDREIAVMSSAIDSDELMVADRGQITKARRSLFGLNLPNFAIFGGNDDPKAQVAEVDATIQQARQGVDGNWRLVLDDGSRWAQTDKRSIPRDPRAGMPIHIKRGAVGSYLANIDKQIAVRVARVN